MDHNGIRVDSALIPDALIYLDVYKRQTRESKYADVVELELYNNILAGVALNGERFFYVNPLEVIPGNCIPRTSREHVKEERQR